MHAVGRRQNYKKTISYLIYFQIISHFEKGVGHFNTKGAYVHFIGETLVNETVVRTKLLLFIGQTRHSQNVDAIKWPHGIYILYSDNLVLLSKIEIDLQRRIYILQQICKTIQNDDVNRTKLKRFQIAYLRYNMSYNCSNKQQTKLRN